MSLKFIILVLDKKITNLDKKDTKNNKLLLIYNIVYNNIY